MLGEHLRIAPDDDALAMLGEPSTLAITISPSSTLSSGNASPARTGYYASGNVTYRLQLSGTAAVLDQTGSAPDLVADARSLLAVASGLVVLH